MGLLAATLKKELLLLIRDRMGLVLLFVMPAVLVTIICLVQAKVLNPITHVLVLDSDKKEIGKIIYKGLKDSDNIIAVKGEDVGCNTEAGAKALVNKGTYQFSIVIPEGCTDFAFDQARLFALAKKGTAGTNNKQITLYFDPSVQGGFRAAVLSAVSKVLLCLEYEIKLRQAVFPTDRRPDATPPDPWFDIKEAWATEFGFIKMPTSVQQNVPAWALFGIFFICVPLAGSMIQERENKTQDRLKTMPVPGFILILGKIVAYICVCLIQFFFVFLIGKFVFPLLGLPAFVVSGPWIAVLIIIAACAVAAANYGIMLGQLAGSYEQALVIGPTTIVIAAALGGIIVPVYLMPGPMQLISNLSPLAWALDAFYDILLRGKQIKAVLPEAGCLVLFGMAASGISYLSFKYKK
ncbi:ABC transporter permease [uncultured Desulfobacter sp.]|uniref:ABC transporter permease n=1 Tax=uncultured Desulfobacter sp. TaxID=240139 RepID=UPI002AA603CF|nr:ABC transporter permease [uncultured Desulfobacter sp.]